MQLTDFRPLSFKSPEQQADLARRYGQNVPYRHDVEYSWLDGTMEMIHAYNSFSLLAQDSPIQNAYEEAGYNPSKDYLVRANEWIENYYPDVWRSIMESRSSQYTRSVINNVQRNHKSAAILGDQGLIGGIAGGVIAGIFDPINWLLPTTGLLLKGRSLSKGLINAVKGAKSAKVAKDIAKLSAADRAVYGAIDNMVATSLIEPLLREKSLTRTEQDFLYDLVGSAILGGGLNASISTIGSGLDQTRKSVSRRLTGGYDSIEEAVEANPERIQAAIKNQIDELPQGDAEKVWERFSGIRNYLDITRDNPEILKADVEMYERAFAEVFPEVGKLEGIGKVLQWFAMNPNQVLLRSASQHTRNFASSLLEGNLKMENQNTFVPIESKIKLVDFIMKRKINEFGGEFTTFVKENPEFDMTVEELRELVYYMIISNSDDILDESFKHDFKVIRDNELVTENIFKTLSNKVFDELDIDPSRARILRNFLRDRAKEYREIIRTLDSSLDSGGFISTVLRDADKNPLQLSAYVSRWVSEHGAGNKKLFEKSVKEGILERKEALRQDIERIIGNYTHELSSILSKIEDPLYTRDPDYSPYEEKKLKRKAKLIEEKIKSGEEELAELNNLIADEKRLTRFAQQIVHNYTLDYNESVIGSKAGSFGSQAQETLARKVDIKDSFLSPFMVRDTAAILDKARLHLIPRVVMADELLNRYGAGGYRNFNRSLGQQIDELARLQDDIQRHQENGNPPTEEQVSEVKNLIDDIVDDVATSRLLNELAVIDSFDGLELDEELYPSMDKLIQSILRSNEQRKKIRRNATDTLIDIKSLEEEIQVGIRAEKIPGIMWNIARTERQLSELEFVDIDDMEPVYEEVLADGDYVPLLDIEDDIKSPGYKENNPHLNKDSRLDGQTIFVTVSKPSKNRGVISIGHQIEVNGKKINVKIKEAAGADTTSKNLAVESDEVPLLYWEGTVEGEKVWGWVNPVELQTAKKIAFADKIAQDLPVTEKSKLSAKLKKLSDEGRKEWAIDEESELLKDFFIRNKDYYKKTLEDKLESLNARLESKIDKDATYDLKSLSRRHQDKYKAFRADRLKMRAIQEELNKIAKEVSEVNQGKGELKDFTKPYLEKAKRDQEDPDQPLSMFEYLGYEDNFKYYDQYGWHPAGITKSMMGADLEDIQIGWSAFQGDLYNTAQLAQNQRRANNQFIQSPLWMMRAIEREGEINPTERQVVADNISFVLDQLRNINPGSKDSHLDMEKFLRIIKNMNYMRYMGMVTISSLGDFANAVGTLGFTRYARTLFETFGDLKSWDDRNSVSGIIAAAEHAESNFRNTQLFGIDGEATYVDPHTGNPYSTERKGWKGLLDKADEGTRGDSKWMQAYNRWGNFLGLWNSFNKRIVSNGLEDMLVEIAIKRAKGTPLRAADKGIIESLRFTDSDLDEIYKRWKQVETLSPSKARKKKIVGRDFYLTNSADWDDNFGYQYLMKLQAAVDTVIVTPSIGDLPKFISSHPLVKALFQFKSFMFATTSKMLLPMVQRGMLYKDPNQLMMVFATSMLGTMSYAIYEILAGKDPFADSVSVDEETGEETRISGMSKAVLQGIDRSGTFAMLFGMNNMMERHVGFGIHSMFGGNLDRRYRSRTLSDTILGPFGSFLTDLSKVVTLGGDIFKGEAPSEGQMTSLRRIVPFQNSIWVKILADGAPSALEALSRGPGFYDESVFDRYTDGYKTIQQRLLNTVWTE